jgi:hypothetical protein
MLTGIWALVTRHHFICLIGKAGRQQYELFLVLTTSRQVHALPVPAGGLRPPGGGPSQGQGR